MFRTGGINPKLTPEGNKTPPRCSSEPAPALAPEQRWHTLCLPGWDPLLSLFLPKEKNKVIRGVGVGVGEPNQ